MIGGRLAIVAVTWRPTFVVHKAIPAKLFCTFQMGVRKVPPTNKICCLLFLLMQLSASDATQKYSWSMWIPSWSPRVPLTKEYHCLNYNYSLKAKKTCSFFAWFSTSATCNYLKNELKPQQSEIFVPFVVNNRRGHLHRDDPLCPSHILWIKGRVWIV